MRVKGQWRATRRRREATGLLSRRVKQAAAMFGLDLEQACDPWLDSWAHRAPHPARRRERVTLLVGPSGGGKTTMLRMIHAEARRRGESVTTVGCAFAPDRPLPGRALVDLFGDVSAEGAMRLLARAGLAEARLFVRTPGELSAGELFRLRLAVAMHRRPGLLLIDEFASNLDAATARSVAMLVRRYADEHPRVRIVAATPRDDLAGHLRPDRIVQCGWRGAAGMVRVLRVPQSAGRTRRDGIVIAPGTFADYAALAHLHYRGGRPATIVKVLSARHRRFGPAGALVVSMPTLNAAWRRLAWPGLFNTGDKREDARRLNHPRLGVRCISRVVVDPRFRSTGLAARLVRAYLRRPMTAHTEAAAAMGRASRFFESAGMRKYDLPPAPRHARLMDLLACAAVEPCDLATPRSAFERASRRLGRRLLERELVLWAKAPGSPCVVRRACRARRQSRVDLFRLFRSACRSVCSTPVAFVHTKGAGRA